MNSKMFLLYAGSIMLVLGILGFLLLDGKLLGFSWQLDWIENTTYALFGFSSLVASFIFDKKIQKMLIQTIATIALFFGMYGFVVAKEVTPNTLDVTNLEYPYENIFNLLLGLWAAYIGFLQKNK